MTQEDVDEVSMVERLCFPNPWPVSAYRRELRNAEQNYYVVLRDVAGPVRVQSGTCAAESASSPKARRFSLWPGNRRFRELPTPILGFAGMWNLFDEAHITTIAMVPEHRGKGLGELLFVALLEEAARRRVNWVTLEVRVSNDGAQALYRKYGFTVQGRRPRYYSDNNEDALIMWSDALRNPEYQDKIQDLRARLSERLGAPIEAMR